MHYRQLRAAVPKKGETRRIRPMHNLAHCTERLFKLVSRERSSNSPAISLIEETKLRRPKKYSSQGRGLGRREIYRKGFTDLQRDPLRIFPKN